MYFREGPSRVGLWWWCWWGAGRPGKHLGLGPKGRRTPLRKMEDFHFRCVCTRSLTAGWRGVWMGDFRQKPVVAKKGGGEWAQ